MFVSLDSGIKKKIFSFCNPRVLLKILAKEKDRVSFLYIKVYWLNLDVSNYISN